MKGFTSFSKSSSLMKEVLLTSLNWKLLRASSKLLVISLASVYIMKNVRKSQLFCFLPFRWNCSCCYADRCWNDAWSRLTNAQLSVFRTHFWVTVQSNHTFYSKHRLAILLMDTIPWPRTICFSSWLLWGQQFSDILHKCSSKIKSLIFLSELLLPVASLLFLLPCWIVQGYRLSFPGLLP